MADASWAVTEIDTEGGTPALPKSQTILQAVTLILVEVSWADDEAICPEIKSQLKSAGRDWASLYEIEVEVQDSILSALCSCRSIIERA